MYEKPCLILIKIWFSKRTAKVLIGKPWLISSNGLAPLIDSSSSLHSCLEIFYLNFRTCIVGVKVSRYFGEIRLTIEKLWNRLDHRRGYFCIAVTKNSLWTRKASSVSSLFNLWFPRPVHCLHTRQRRLSDSWCANWIRFYGFLMVSKMYTRTAKILIRLCWFADWPRMVSLY